LPEGLKLVFDLILYLGQHSYHQLDCGGGGDGERPSDGLADELLCEVARELRKCDGEWAPVMELERLKKENKMLNDYGN
jgi:hypothetical protein